MHMYIHTTDLLLCYCQVYKLPALLVEDFDDVTPDRLRSAYVEALYRAAGAEFDFRRLNMHFWTDLVMNVSKTMSTDALFDKFPPVPNLSKCLCYLFFVIIINIFK